MNESNNLNKNSIFKEFFKLTKPYYRPIISLSVLIIFLEAFSLVGPYILKIIIDEILIFSPDKIRYFILLIFVFFLSLLILSVANYFKDKKIFSVILKAEYDIPISCV